MVEKLVCESCQYRFIPKTGKVPARCPYCGKNGTIGRIKLMQDFLDESNSGGSFRA